MRTSNGRAPYKYSTITINAFFLQAQLFQYYFIIIDLVCNALSLQSNEKCLCYTFCQTQYCQIKAFLTQTIHHIRKYKRIAQFACIFPDYSSVNAFLIKWHNSVKQEKKHNNKSNAFNQFSSTAMAITVGLWRFPFLTKHSACFWFGATPAKAWRFLLISVSLYSIEITFLRIRPLAEKLSNSQRSLRVSKS